MSVSACLTLTRHLYFSLKFFASLNSISSLLISLSLHLYFSLKFFAFLNSISSLLFSLSPSLSALIREFEMAEIEHFVDPTNKNHPKFKTVAHLVVPIFSACLQRDAKQPEPMSLGDAVKNVCC